MAGKRGVSLGYTVILLLFTILIFSCSAAAEEYNWGAYGGGAGITGGSGESVSTPLPPPPQVPTTPEGSQPQERYVAPTPPPARTGSYVATPTPSTPSAPSPQTGSYSATPVATGEQGSSTPQPIAAAFPNPSSSEARKQYLEGEGITTQGEKILKTYYDPCRRRNGAICNSISQCYWNGRMCLSAQSYPKERGSEDYADYTTYNEENPGEFDFRMSAKPISTNKIIPGSSTSYNINIDVLSGSVSGMRLGIVGVPDGASASLAKTENPYVVVLTVSALQNAIPGTYQIGVRGTDGNIVRKTTVPLTIVDAPTISGSMVRNIIESNYDFPEILSQMSAALRTLFKI